MYCVSYICLVFKCACVFNVVSYMKNPIFTYVIYLYIYVCVCVYIY